nr:hypothetical protein [uncultured Pedobacter sp.]
MPQYKLNNWYLLVSLILTTSLLAYAFSHLLLTRDIYYNSFQDQLDNARIDELFDFRTKYEWISYIFIPIWLLFKNFLISLCLQVGLLISNAKVKFSDTFRIALTAEFIFLVPQVIRFCWFLIFKTDYTLTDIQQFYPLSALNLFKIENLSTLLLYPLQTFNLFEFLYWVLLAGGIKQVLNKDLNYGIKVVFSGYIPALVLWIICVMFITVSLSPTT